MKNRSSEKEVMERLNLILPDLQAGIPPADILEKRNLSWGPEYIPFLKRKARGLGIEIPRSSASSAYDLQKRVIRTKPPKGSQVKKGVTKTLSHTTEVEQDTVTVVFKGIEFIIPAGTHRVRVLPNGSIEISWKTNSYLLTMSYYSHSSFFINQM